MPYKSVFEEVAVLKRFPKRSPKDKSKAILNERAEIHALRKQMRSAKLPESSANDRPIEEQIKIVRKGIFQVGKKLEKLLAKNPGMTGTVIASNVKVKKGNVKDQHDWEKLVAETFASSRTPDDEAQILRLQKVLNQKLFDLEMLNHRVNNPRFNSNVPTGRAK